MFDALYALPDEGDPFCLELTAPKREYFVQWHDAHCAEAESPELSPFLQGAYAKLKGYCARLALIHALCTDPGARVVEAKSIAASAAMIEYFKIQAVKVATALHRAGSNPLERCKAAVRRRLSVSVRQNISKRDLQRCVTAEASVFNQAINEMSQPEIKVTPMGTTEFIRLWRSDQQE